MTRIIGWTPASQHPLVKLPNPLTSQSAGCIEIIRRELLAAEPNSNFFARVNVFRLSCLQKEYWDQILSGSVHEIDPAERADFVRELAASTLSFNAYQSGLARSNLFVNQFLDEKSLPENTKNELKTALIHALEFEERAAQEVYLNCIETEVKQSRQNQKNLSLLFSDLTAGTVSSNALEHYHLPLDLSAASSTLIERVEKAKQHARRLALGHLMQSDQISEADGIVGTSLSEIEVRSRQVAQAMLQMSKGDFSQTLQSTGENDALIESFNQLSENVRAVITQVDSVARGEYQEDIVPLSDHDLLGAALQKMTFFLRQTYEENLAQLAIIEGINSLNDVMRRDADTRDLCAEITSFLARYSKASVGILYVQSLDDSQFERLGSYAVNSGERSEFVALGEGLIGQVAQDRQLLRVKKPTAEHLNIRSGLVAEAPREVVIFPLALGERCVAVLELGYLEGIQPAVQKFIEIASENIAIAIERSQSRSRARELLTESTTLTEELQSQRTEIMAANRQLEEQTRQLELSEEQMQEQSTELESTNRTLERHNNTLETQSAALDQKNIQLEKTREMLEAQAAQLALSSRYKSEFLANMSHELRTPLNSMLLLAKHLADNSQGHLDEQEVESATIVYSSGNDLLSLINEILDLAKVEAGKMAISVQSCPLTPLIDNMQKSFSPLAQEKLLSLEFDVAPELVIMTDAGRLEQILRNLLSNAIKFTQAGSVKLSVAYSDKVDKKKSILFTVDDTGIGIPQKMKDVIFEAFQQVEGGIDRQHGGTGLGLSISRELATLLNGQLRLVRSSPEGSCFQLSLPVESEVNVSAVVVTDAIDEAPVSQELSQRAALKKPVSQPSRQPSVISAKELIEDDRSDLLANETTLLIIEDDVRFATILRDLCRKQGFQVLVAQSGEEGLELVQKHKPQGVLLDLQLPGMDGFSVLDELKNDPRTRHIAVHIISLEEENLLAYRKGAIGFLQKPVSEEQLHSALQRLETTFGRAVKELLIIEDNDAMRHAMRTLLGNGDIHTTESQTGHDAINLLTTRQFDCVILDLGLPDMDGFELLDRLRKKLTRMPPIVVYTGRELTEEQTGRLHEYAESIIIKGVRSEERLLDETSIFLHRMVERMPAPKQRIIQDLRNADTILENRRVLLVEDDMRSAFALGKLLTERGLDVTKAENGQRALDVIQEQTFDIVLMDVMMPVMDGITATKAIRAMPHLKELPIIALTAKAMAEDRDRCLEAGANDYLTKPTDFARLCSMMRVWLYR